MGSREQPAPGEDLSTEGETLEERTDNFFKREYKAFHAEKNKNFHDIPRRYPTIDFDELIREFEGEGRDPKKKWENFFKKIRPLMLFSILAGFFWFLVSLLQVLLDFQAAYEYLGGSWYFYYFRDENKLGKVLRDESKECRNATEWTEDIFGWVFLRGETDYKLGAMHEYTECFEKDIPWGVLTLLFAFLSGFFWTGQIFYRLWIYLTKKNRACYGRKTVLFFFFIPLSIISVATFPIQHVLINFIGIFNVQDQWTLLNWKLGIAEGLFNSHFQFVLQYFIQFVAVSRYPTTFQTVLIGLELLEIPTTRIESLLLDRGGHRMSPGQKLWWFLRFGPSFTFNCFFKIGSIGAVIAILRFNSIWFYGGLFLIWLILQILFIEQKIPRKYYYLLLGAGKHAVTVTFLPPYTKIIGTDRDTGKTVLWSCRLSSREIQTNLWFHNMMWFVFNTVIISSVLLTEHLMENKKEIQVFWPFTPSHTYKISNEDLNMFNLRWISLAIILCGAIAQILNTECFMVAYTDDDNYSSRRYKGWHYVETDPDGRWLKYEYNQDLHTSVRGRCKEMIFPFVIIWENLGDKDTYILHEIS